MKCPHCTVEIHPTFTHTHLTQGQRISTENQVSYSFAAGTMTCPACHKGIVYLYKYGPVANQPPAAVSMVYPRSAQRPLAPSDVPADLAEDFNEAAKVLEDSPKASAALGRRCLQALLRDQGYKQHDLAKAIDAVLAAKVLPSSLAENLDAVRVTGNFAAHPTKDSNSGAILPVEDHEAEWNLEVLEGLFDYYYVQPAKDKARRAALASKLAAAGKPGMKQ